MTPTVSCEWPPPSPPLSSRTFGVTTSRSPPDGVVAEVVDLCEDCVCDGFECEEPLPELADEPDFFSGFVEACPVGFTLGLVDAAL